jgi:hypothetical protein
MYKELARIVGVDIDSVTSYGKRMPVSDSLYSVALGSLEMTLYEQMHLFNVLYSNDIIERPSEHPSLVIDSVALDNVPLSIPDTIKRYHPFSDINNLRPTWLGMHKRLVSNAADGLGAYDIACPDSLDAGTNDTVFSSDACILEGAPSNFAKSGTTDDVIRPFDADMTSSRRTNYGLWNAVIRIDLGRFSSDTASRITDVTVACMGECSQKFTGERDGKTLHKFLTAGLLKKGGIRTENGFYARYENYLKRVTPPQMKKCEKQGQ